MSLKAFIAATVFLSSTMAVMAGETNPASSPVELVREAVNNEVQSNGSSGRHFMFKDQKKTVHLTETKLLVETRDAMAGMLIEHDGHPLSPQERQQEMARLENYAKNPAELNKKKKQEKEDAEHTERILKALPQAFLYEYEGTEAGNDAMGRAGDKLVRLKFRPNPAYNPPSRVEQVLTGMEGELLIDNTEKRIAKIDGTLAKDVGFGWGILGHLDRGGRFLVQQADIGGHQWELTRMELSLTGKILLLKKLVIRSSEIFSDFHPVPSDLTFQQGVELLKKEASSWTPQNPGASGKTTNSGKQAATQARKESDAQLCCER